MSKDLSIFDNKIIVLYILDAAKKPLTIDQIVNFSLDFDDITYFDICMYVEELKKNKYIDEVFEHNISLFKLNDNGENILKELSELIPGSDLYTVKKIISKNIVKLKTDYSIGSDLILVKSDEYKISCYIKDGNDELLNITIYAGDKEHAKKISQNFSENSENIYNTIIKLMIND